MKTNDPTPAQSTIPVSVEKIRGSYEEGSSDKLAVEEPLEIRLGFELDGKRIHRSISITMRTPGQDADLACGFLFTEGIIRSPSEIEDVRHCGPIADGAKSRNIIRIELANDLKVDYHRLERHFYTNSSCGVCGKKSIDALQIESYYPIKNKSGQKPMFLADEIHELPRLLRKYQDVFDSTGGLHAAALFDTNLEPVIVREDVGRHNALDKLLGAALRAGLMPLKDHLLLVSGRVSFELVQKAVMAGIPILAAVGAPSSLAFECAAEAGMTLLGFVRNNSFNIYSGSWRIDKPGKSNEIEDSGEFPAFADLARRG